MDKRILTHADCRMAVEQMKAHYFELGFTEFVTDRFSVYGVPRGGIPVAYLVGTGVVECPSRATLIVDDIIDSGRTRDRYRKQFPNTPFLALADFLSPPKIKGQWIVFPWEQGEGVDTSADDIVIRLLQYIGEDPERGGLKETPARVLRAWKEWTAGYAMKPADVLKVFTDGARGYDEMIFQKNIPFYSHCEHHLAPFFGTATIAYIPNDVVIGASKLSRILDVFAKRLQIQERITTQVADAIEELLSPKGVGVILKARHLCMESRGICKQGEEMITSALRGVMRTNDAARMEFLHMGG